MKKIVIGGFMMLVNPCFFKQSKDTYFISSRTGDKSSICEHYSMSTWLEAYYCSDWESHFIINFDIFTCNLSFLLTTTKYYQKTGYKNYNDNTNY